MGWAAKQVEVLDQAGAGFPFRRPLDSGEAHLRRIRISYAAYYNSVRTHRSLHKDASSFCPIQQIGIIR